MIFRGLEPAMSFPMNRASVLFFALGLLAAAGPARGADTWTKPFPGVSQLKRTTSVPEEIFALKIDTCARGVAFRATQESEKKRTVSSFRSLVKAQAAINGDFFSYADYYPSSFAVGQGTKWHDDDSKHGFIAFGPDRSEISTPSVVLAQAEAWMKQAVGGYPMLLDKGALMSAYTPSHCSVRHPRTAVGLSKDRQTLLLVIVDGRTNISKGMTCKELATLMLDLGAWRALNLDGGGSSTLSIEGKGAINNPSDGAERVVSDHLAVFADGVGAPGSCDLWMDEAIVDAGMLGGANTTDMNGDGKADLCARAAAGWRCYPSTGSGFGTAVTTTSFSNASGYDDESNFATIRMGDVTGDGKADVCVRANTKVVCLPSKGTSWGTAIDGPALSDASGWAAPEYFTTLRLADINGDGKDDLCARAAVGLQCWPATGTGFGAAITGPAWSDSSGWNTPERYATIRTGDVNGDGRQDVCARGSAGMTCAISNGTGFPTTITGPAWSDAAGFKEVTYWSTIRLVDLNGDGRADLCARTEAGVQCALSSGTAFGALITGPALSDTSGWGDLDNATTIRFGDLDDDGDQDLCARANAGIRCWPWTGAGFGAQITGPAWKDADGWDDFRLYSSFHMGDLNGDGKADVCGRAADGVHCAKSTGAAFGTEIKTTLLPDSSGWSGNPYFQTLRFAGPRCAAKAEVCNGKDDDCDGVIDDGDPGAGAACAGTGVGVCGAGVTACNAGAIACVVAGTPSAEVCNGKDDDCDGDTDEGVPGEGASCDTGALGVCQPGTTGCLASTMACVPNVVASSEVCNGVDDDCDGETDEGYVSVTTTCGIPPCDAVGHTECLAGLVTPVCTPADGTPCGAVQGCLTAGVCASGQCVGGQAIPGACDDGNGCTTDDCDPALGCVHGAATGDCDDHNVCTAFDHCTAGACAAGSAVSCDDDNPCTKDGCFPADGCHNAPTAAACGDGDPCTDNVCQDGVCVVTNPTECTGDDPVDAGSTADVTPGTDSDATPGAGADEDGASDDAAAGPGVDAGNTDPSEADVTSGAEDATDAPDDAAGQGDTGETTPVPPPIDDSGCAAAPMAGPVGGMMWLVVGMLVTMSWRRRRAG